jgi:radical SAM protein with 4Fe4S-binding SPASM domain
MSSQLIARDVVQPATIYHRRARAFGKLLAPGVHMPVYALVFVTTRCNAACEHCFYWDELNKNLRSELPVEEYDKLARSMGSMLQITFTGGSPELRKDLPDIVERFYEHCSPSQMTFCMLGYATDKIVQHVEAMLKRCPQQRLKIAISLDGLGEEHNELRKLKGLFDRVVGTVTSLGALKNDWPNLRLDIGITVHGLNYKTAERTALWARENLPIDVLKPILVRGNPYNPKTLNDVCKTTYLSVVQRDREWVSGVRGGLFSPMDFVVSAKEAMQRELIGRISHTHVNDLTCGGARETAVVYPTGNVAGCELRDEVLGNVRDVDYDLSKIWFNDQADSFRQSAGKVNECRGCYHHCFLAPAMFRTPKLWPTLVKTASSIYWNSRS